jgi:hypothetical protein
MLIIPPWSHMSPASARQSTWTGTANQSTRTWLRLAGSPTARAVDLEVRHHEQDELHGDEHPLLFLHRIGDRLQPRDQRQ